ncbi:hypothetical protein [Duncaniella muris]|uniref:hypothetical protein n=1 Tax=Duncaniella muris TaxID=2094150 RepID=UPI003F678BF3
MRRGTFLERENDGQEVVWKEVSYPGHGNPDGYLKGIFGYEDQGQFLSPKIANLIDIGHVEHRARCDQMINNLLPILQRELSWKVRSMRAQEAADTKGSRRGSLWSSTFHVALTNNICEEQNGNEEEAKPFSIKDLDDKRHAYVVVVTRGVTCAIVVHQPES